jgi:tRNA (guanine37-N1)-methyltransferase
LRVDVLTLFPEMFEHSFGGGIFQRAVSQKLVTINCHNIRDYTHDRHHSVDDCVYGGGAGMVLKPEPIYEAAEAVMAQIRQEVKGKVLPVILLTPQGHLFSQALAQELAGYSHLLLICGQYEGVDERVREHVATLEISIGDYVLSGGELAAMVVINAVVRLLPGVLGAEDSAADDSHSEGLLEYPQYTRPASFRGWAVPEILLSGNHAKIARWRRQQAIIRTLKRRPELLSRAKLSAEEKKLVAGKLLDSIPDADEDDF